MWADVRHTAADDANCDLDGRKADAPPRSADGVMVHVSEDVDRTVDAENSKDGTASLVSVSRQQSYRCDLQASKEEQNHGRSLLFVRELCGEDSRQRSEHDEGVEEHV